MVVIIIGFTKILRAIQYSIIILRKWPKFLRWSYLMVGNSGVCACNGKNKF